MKQSNRFASEQPENMKPKLLVIFVIDNSTAMTIGRMESINNFLNSFYKSIQQGDCHPFEEVMIDRLELCIITYSDSVQTLRKASLIGEHEVAPRIKRSTGNSNCIITAINKAIDIIEERKKWYKEVGQYYYRPYIYLFSADGLTESESEEYIALRNRVLDDYRHKRYYIFNADIDFTASSDSELQNEIWPLTIHSLHELWLTIYTIGIHHYDDISIIHPESNTDTIDLSGESWLDEFNI